MEATKLIIACSALKDTVRAGVTGIVRGMVQNVSREVCNRTLIDYHIIQLSYNDGARSV